MRILSVGIVRASDDSCNNAVIAGTDGGSKVARACELGVAILDESAFLALIEASAP